MQTYNYDSVNRLKDATEMITPHGGSQVESWKQTFEFDRYGNRRFDQSNTTMPASFANPAITNPTVSPNTNKITSTGYAFDAAGNTTRDTSDRKFTYDSENKQVKVESLSSGTQTVTGTVGEYVYDGDGRRVKKRAYENNVLTEETIFVYDAAGKLIGEYSNQVASLQDAIVSYLTTDQLGSPRINTDINGNVTARHDYHPFGEEIATGQRTSGLGYADDTIRKQFTGYERDDETELDFAQARYYAKNHGRFNSPDPARMLGARMADPQHWNLYIYGRNNPLLFVDITGEFPYTVYVRSFAPPGAFSGRGFHDDGRGFSTDTSSGTTSRVQQQITIDPTAQNWGNHQVTSSPTDWNGVIQATDTPYGRVKESAFQTQNGISTAAVSTEYSGLNPLTKQISESATPAIDVQSTIAVAENSTTGQVLVSVKLTGDRFPATEAFVADQKGNKVFIVGANAYGSPETGLPGNPKLPVASASLLINTDKKGAFTGVVYQGKTYSVDDWNKKALATPVQMRPRKEQDCNCIN